MDAKLVLLGQDGKTGEYKLRPPAVLGRSGEANLTIVHTSVSRQHCEIYEYEGQLAVRDLGSLNGTFVNDQRVTEPTFLPPGSELRLGSVAFRAEYDAASDPSTTDATIEAEFGPFIASDPTEPKQP